MSLVTKGLGSVWITVKGYGFSGTFEQAPDSFLTRKELQDHLLTDSELSELVIASVSIQGVLLNGLENRVIFEKELNDIFGYGLKKRVVLSSFLLTANFKTQITFEAENQPIINYTINSRNVLNFPTLTTITGKRVRLSTNSLESQSTSIDCTMIFKEINSPFEQIYMDERTKYRETYYENALIR